MGQQPIQPLALEVNVLGCAGKERLINRRLAETVARRMRKTHKARLRAYRCPECAGWHVGTPK